MVTFRGPGSVTARKQFWIEEEGKVSIPPTGTFPKGLTLEAVHVYKHLGGVISDKQDLAPELAYRVSSTTSSLQALRQVVFRNQQLSRQHKLQLADVLIMSGR
eukprot:9466128-Pyramimonas_sp.AAC.1